MKINRASLIILGAILLLLCACESEHSSYTTTGAPTSSTNSDGTLSFELIDNLTLEFDPLTVKNPETASVVKAKRINYDFDALCEVFKVLGNEAVLVEERSSPVEEILITEEGNFTNILSLQFLEADVPEGREQLGTLMYSRFPFEDSSLNEIWGLMGIGPSNRRLISPYLGGKDLEGLDFEKNRSCFESIISSVSCDENAPIVLDKVYSMSKDEQAEFWVSEDNPNRKWDFDSGFFHTALPDKEYNMLSNVQVFYWRQQVKGIPMANLEWAQKFESNSGKTAACYVSGYIEADGSSSLYMSNLISVKEIGQARKVVPFEAILKKLNNTLSLSLEDKKYSVAEAELCYAVFVGETRADYVLYPFWIFAVETEAPEHLGYDENGESVRISGWNLEPRNIYAYNAFTGELVADAELPQE